MNWLLWVLLSSLFGAFAVIIKKKALIQEHATEFLTTFKLFEIITLVFFIHLMNFITSFTISTIFYRGYKDLIHGIKNAGKIISLNAIFATLSNITYLYAISMTMISLVLPVKRLSTLIAVIIGGKLFHEHNLMQRIIACIIMLFGIILVAI